jgi:hypothetical protein
VGFSPQPGALQGFLLFAPLNQHRRWRQGAGKDDPRDFFLDTALVKIENTEAGSAGSESTLEKHIISAK